MILAELSLGAPRWLGWAAGLSVLALVVIAWSYARSQSAGWVRATAALLKTLGIVALATCLVEPLFTGQRPRPGSNLFLIAADISRSQQLKDGGTRTRGQIMQARLDGKSPWLTRLSQDFDVRKYAFDTALHPVTDFANLTLDGNASAVAGSLQSLADRYRGRPIAGILLLTDGNATDLGEREPDWKGLPPVYPVVTGTSSSTKDLSVTRVSVSQTNFEAAPVTIAAQVEGRSVAGRKVVVRVLDEAGKELETRTVDRFPNGEPLVERFLLRPEKPGVSFYTVQASLAGEETLPPDGKTVEATLANNRRLATVDRGRGPYRVLYVTGRLNWEFKFLRRALADDDEVSLVGLVRVARREPKFKFLSRDGERTNPLFKGFDKTDETSEQYDQPVLVRLGTEGKDELRGGFPKTAAELFAWHAVIVDDLEAEFFTRDQQSLVQQFVSRRGGGFLMLGGKDSFADGKYQRTPVGELLPVYLDRMAPAASGGYRLKLTKEGWLQPWVRLRTNEADEEERLAGMPVFKTLNAVNAIKPGASVLAHVQAADGSDRPALVIQQFGRGRSAAMLLGDLWRWDIRRPDPAQSDLAKSWRQTVRWLVSDVPLPVEVSNRPLPGDTNGGVQIVVRTRDRQYEPLDNAAVAVRVQTPDKREIEITAEGSGGSPGEYLATFVPRLPGAYRAKVTATAADGSELGTRETGWTVEPETEEFKRLEPDRGLLERIAKETGGEVLSLDGLEAFVRTLPNRKVPVVETWSYPLWHQWPVFLVAIACLIAEWALRRWRGLA